MRLWLCLMALCGSTLAMAQTEHYTSVSGGVRHYITLSLKGGEANTFMSSTPRMMNYNYPYVPQSSNPSAFMDKQGLGYMVNQYVGLDSIVNLPGGDAQFELGYEVRKRNFFFAVEGNVHYTYTGQKVKNEELIYRDTYLRMDRVNYTPADEPYLDEFQMEQWYDYRNYRENQHTLQVGGGVKFGYYVIPRLYIALGAKVDYALISRYKASVTMQTGGRPVVSQGNFGSDTYKNQLERYPLFSTQYNEIVNEAAEDYGWFILDHELKKEGNYDATVMDDQGRMVQNLKLMVSPQLEIGTRFQISERVSFRLAAYAEYGIPIRPDTSGLTLDYSMVERDNPSPTWGGVMLPGMAPGLADRVQMHSLMNHRGQDRYYSRLSVGVKFQVLFDVTPGKPCLTCEDDSGIAYRTNKKYRRRRYKVHVVDDELR